MVIKKKSEDKRRQREPNRKKPNNPSAKKGKGKAQDTEPEIDTAEDSDATLDCIEVEIPKELTETDRRNQQRYQQFLDGEEERRRNAPHQQAKERLGHRYMRGG
jgi:hypothetical protein